MTSIDTLVSTLTGGFNAKMSTSYELIDQTTTDQSNSLKNNQADEKIYASKENHCYIIIQVCDVHEFFSNGKSI